MALGALGTVATVGNVGRTVTKVETNLGRGVGNPATKGVTNPEVPKLTPPPIPDGVTQSQFGKNVVGWGARDPMLR